MVFDRLDARLQTLLDEAGIELATPLQAVAMPPILAGKHTLVLGPTGMGKTEAAVLPVLQELIGLPDDERKGFSVLYVTPLRALNRDILARLTDWCDELGITVGVRHGDTTQAERARQSRKPPEFLITTPETVQAMMTGARLRQHLANVRFVVVDEIHELVGEERGAQLACALERVARRAGEFQRVGLSATVGDPHEAAAFLGGRDREVEIAKAVVERPLELSVEHPAPIGSDAALAERLYCSPVEAALVRRIAELVDEHTSTLIFVNTRRMAEVLAARLSFWGREDIVVHHGSLHVETRVATEEAFKQREVKGLICTSSMELGIDIGSADLVIQVNSPREVARLLQRVGRAGHRIGLTPKGVVLVTDADDVAEAVSIVRRAHRGEVESPRVPECPLDVLANQLEGLSIEEDVPLEEALAILGRARPFWELTEAEIKETLRLLESTRLVGLDNGVVRRYGRARTHFVENLSMIPDQTNFLVRDVATRKPIGTLDEAFVASYVEPGALFIFKGHPWRVIELRTEGVSEPDILVAPVKDPTGAVPSWVGEEIPVPYTVAQDVGELRRELAEALVAGTDPKDVLVEQAGLDEPTAELLATLVRAQGPLVMPTADVVVLETGPGAAVLNCCLGHKANEALGTALSGLLAARLGQSVGLDVDPYRVMLELPRRVRPDIVDDVLTELQGVPLEPLLRPLLNNAPVLRFKLVHVARKFGVLDRAASTPNVAIGHLLERFRDTPLHREAVREVLHERLDVERAQAFLTELADGHIELVHQRISPVGQAGFEESLSLVAPRRATAAILTAIEQRLMDEPVVLACLHCRKWQRETRVRRIPFPLTCPRCHARVITLVRPWQKDRLQLIGRDGLTGEQRSTMRRMNAAASLLAAHGEDAALLLVARGIGPDTAGRLIRKQRGDREGLLRDVLEAEVTYARTRAFWD